MYTLFNLPARSPGTKFLEGHLQLLTRHFSATTNLNQWFNSGDQAYIIVSVSRIQLIDPRVEGLTEGVVMYGPAHDSGPGIPVLGACTKEVRTVYDMGMYGLVLDYRLPMVFLGIFVSIQLLSNQWIYRQSTTFWSDEYARNAFAWIASHP